MTDQTRPYPDDRLPTALLALVLFLVGLFGIAYYFNCSFEPQVTFCGCGHDSSEVQELQDDEPLEMAGKRKIKKVWFAGGHPKGSSEKQFQVDVMAGLNYLASFTNTDFVQSPTSSGAYIRFNVYTNQQFWDRWSYYRKSKSVPLASHSGNEITFTDHERANGWVTAATIHEVGHRIGVKPFHSDDRTSIMHPDLPVKTLNENDRAAFTKKLGKKVSYRFDGKSIGLAA
jgi:hypothetical protein